MSGLKNSGESVCPASPSSNGNSKASADQFALDTRADGVWDDYQVVDGRLVTGQNPQSARSTAKAALEAFEKL